MLRPCLALTALSGFLLLPGCGGGNRLPADAAGILEKADTIELVSLDPDRQTQDPTGFRGWKVLGRVTLTGEDKKSVVAALRKGVADSDGMVAACFNPRHGIEATFEGKTVALVICYECKSISGWVDGERFGVLTTSGPAADFNRVLQAKGVKLPKAKE